MGSANSLQERGPHGHGAGVQPTTTGSQSPENLAAQVVRQLAINWNTFDREFQAVVVELLTRVLCTTNDDVCGLVAAGAGISTGSGGGGGSVPVMSAPSSPQAQSHAQPATTSGRPHFSSTQPIRSTRSTNTTLSNSFSGARSPANAAATVLGTGEVPITSQDLEALAIAFLSLEIEGCMALVDSMAFIVSGQTRRERNESQVNTSASSSVQQQGATPSTTRSNSTPRFAAAAATTALNGVATPMSRGNSAPTAGAGLPVGSLSTLSSFLLTGSQDSPFRASANVQLQQLQRQQEQMRLAPTSFSEHAYNNGLLMSMSARSSNSDLHMASRRHSSVQLSSSRGSSSIPLPPARSQPHPAQQRRLSSLDNFSATTAGLSSPHTSRMLTPHAPSAFANVAAAAPAVTSNVSGSVMISGGGASSVSHLTSRRPSFASGTRSILATQNNSMISMSSATLGELQLAPHTAAALSYIPADNTFYYTDKLVGHTPASVLKSLNTLLAHLHVPEHSVAALWVLFFEVLCDVQERVQYLSAAQGGGAASSAALNPVTSSGAFSRLGASGHITHQPATNATSLSSADDLVLSSPSITHVAGGVAVTFPRQTSSAAVSTACRLAVVPVVEKLVLPHYNDVCAALGFAAGSAEAALPLTELALMDSSDGRTEPWRAASATVSEQRAGSLDSPSRGGAGRPEENALRHSLSGGLPSLAHSCSAAAIRPLHVPSAHSRQFNNYVSAPSGGAGRTRARGGAGGGEGSMVSRAQLYFREESKMLLGSSGSGSGAAANSAAAKPGTTTTTTAAANAMSRTGGSDTMIAEPLVQKTTFVLHYAERISLTASSSPSTPPSQAAPSVVSLWQMRTRLVSLRQHYLYVYDAMATTIALLGGDLAATVALPSANVELNAPIALVDLAGAAGSDVRVVSGPSDAEVMPVRASRVSRGRPPQADPFFTADEQHNAALLKGTRSEDTAVYRMQNDEGELFLLVLPVASRGNGGTGSAEQNAVTATTTELEQRLSRPGVLSLMPADRTGGGARAQTFTRVQGEEHVALSVHPLRILCQGVLHHFFFQNANVRAQWFDHIMATTMMLHSRRQLARVANAPQHMSQFIHRRISFPVGPAAFEYLDMLGVGGFGRVLLVRHKLAGKLFAMKIIRKFKFHGMRNVVEVRRECHTLRSVDNPYVMKIHTIFQTDSRVYILLDYLPGGELLVHTQKTDSHHFDNDTARFFIAELAIALESLREQGIVHRDIKGDNVVLDADGHAVLTDFGFAKVIVEDDPTIVQDARAGALREPRRAEDDRHPRGRIRWQHSSCGTLAYLAPEVLQRTPPRNGYGLEADWWSLGVVLFTMLTGYFPFLKEDNESTKRAIVASQLQFPPKVALSDSARDLMKGLMEKDPLRRISTLAQMRDHAFFTGFDWKACEARRLRPPVLLHKDMYKSPSSGSSAARRLRDTVVAIIENEQAKRAGRGADNGDDDQDDDEVTKDGVLVTPANAQRAVTDVVPNKKYAHELQEEIDELRLVEKAFGPDVVPVPTTLEGDVFGPLYAYQEECGSDRDDLFDEDPTADFTPPRRTTAAGGAGGGGGLPRAPSTGWFDPSDGNYIPRVDYGLPLSPSGMRSGVGSAALLRAQERENALLGPTTPVGTHDLLASPFAEGDLLPIIQDFDEAAYMSLQDVQPTDAQLASDATGFFRPVITDPSQ